MFSALHLIWIIPICLGFGIICAAMMCTSGNMSRAMEIMELKMELEQKNKEVTA